MIIVGTLFAALIVTVAVCVPAESADGSAVKRSVAGMDPMFGETVSHAAPAEIEVLNGIPGIDPVMFTD
jgi:hypothetical protein